MKLTNFLPATPQRVGIMVSGGFDSAVLLYLLTKENKEKGSPHQIIAMTVAKGDNAPEHSARIVKHIEQLNGVIIQHIEISKPDISIPESTLNSVTEGLVDMVFSGSTDVPSDLRSMRSSPIRPLVPVEYQDIIFVPWENVCKDEILKFAIEEGLDGIIALSHSCARRDMIINRCGQCYNCVERAWAFNKNNLADPGTC